MPTVLASAMETAVREARRFVGATCPNPPVGAAALDETGQILHVRAHERAGNAHAEAALLADCERQGLLARVRTLVVTLEPCNHHGRTPPCTEAILRAVPHGLTRVVYGEADPNPRVAGGGAARLRTEGLAVEGYSTAETRELLAPFAHRCRTGQPWVTIKVARDAQGNMIPPPGRKTFTSESSLTLAHTLRRESDALITGVGTVLADQPEFTVRRVPDHPGKRRWLVVLDRQRRTPPAWIQAREAAGFEVWLRDDYDSTLRELGEKGCLSALVEAGPGVTDALLTRPDRPWQRLVEFRVRDGSTDEIRVL